MKLKKFLATVVCTAVVAVSVLAGDFVKAEAANETLLNTYGKTYGHVGTCINYNQLTNPTVMNHLKSQYNSITLENEMKPDALLGWSANLISVSQAKNMGYYIPDGYTEQYVPKINFDTIDKVMKICYENGIGMRAHTLVWHSQTPSWFFRYGYNGNNGFVNTSMMDARMEFYIKTVMNHVYSSQYGSCVYAWDVVNEYFHATNSGWEAVYGKGGTRPAFVKKAFQYAYDCLSYYKLTDKVSLFYNDFNTYQEVNDIITMINYINAEKKICNGVGMQSHLGTDYPSVDYYISALKSFVNAGLEVQITELDVTNTSSYAQANYIYNLMKNVNSIKKSGGNITGVTIWGLSDDVSWITGGKNPLLFSSLGVAKDSYYKFIQAYTETGFVAGNSTQPTQPTQPSNPTQPTQPTQPTNTDNNATMADGWYYIKNVNAQKYLQVANNSAESGANVEIGSGTGVKGQKWYLTNKGNGVFTLTNGQGCMLDVTGGKNQNATNIETWTANNHTAQNFMLKSAGNNQYGIVTAVSNGSKGLDVSNQSKEDGANVQQYDYYGGANQLWVLEPVGGAANNDNNNTNNNGNNTENNNKPENNTPVVDQSKVVVADGWYYIKNHNAQKYLQVANNQGANGVNVEIGTGTGVKGQKWYVTNTPDGYVTLTNGQGFKLDITYGEDKDGANIQTYQDNGQDAQKFKIVDLGNKQYAIVTKVSQDGKALDVYNFETADGANVCQWTYYKNANQIWYFEACDNGGAPANNNQNQDQGNQNQGNQNQGNQNQGNTTQTGSIIRPAQASLNKSTPYSATAYNNSVSYGTMTKKYYYSTYTNSYRAYNILLPSGYTEGKKYPVIYMLHGIGGNEDAFGNNLSNSALMRIAGNLMASGEAKEAIIVFPSIRVSTTAENNMFSNQNFGYYDLFREDLINCLMPHINSTYSVATGRENTAVAGFSMGGRESLYIGISKPDVFGYTAAFCPAPGNLANSMNGVTEKGLFTNAGFKLPANYNQNTFVMIVKGASDNVVGDQPMLYHNTLSQNGTDHVFYEISGGHDEGVYGNGFYNFLKNVFK